MPVEETISSTKNPAVLAAVRLHRTRHRRADLRTLIEGPDVVAEAIAAGAGVSEIFATSEEARVSAVAAGAVFRLVTDDVLQRIAGTENPRGPVAIIHIPESQIPLEKRVLVAWGVSDPGNCGTLLRTAAAFGYGYISGPGSADPWSPKVLRSAAGGHFHTSVGLIASVADLGERHVVGTVPRGGEAAGGVAVGTAIVVGSEAHGIPPEVVERCDQLVSVPMPGGVESLNAAVAGAIVAYLGVTQSLKG
jgi:TrmH family RNA methyltransferase